MRGRKLRRAVAAGCVLALSVSLFWPSRVTWENYDRVREGMGRPEVYALLGDPEDEPFGTPGTGGEAWRHGRETFAVWFDADGRVKGKVYSAGNCRAWDDQFLDDLRHLWRRLVRLSRRPA